MVNNKSGNLKKIGGFAPRNSEIIRILNASASAAVPLPQSRGYTRLNGDELQKPLFAFAVCSLRVSFLVVARQPPDEAPLLVSSSSWFCFCVSGLSSAFARGDESRHGGGGWGSVSTTASSAGASRSNSAKL